MTRYLPTKSYRSRVVKDLSGRTAAAEKAGAGMRGCRAELRATVHSSNPRRVLGNIMDYI